MYLIFQVQLEVSCLETPHQSGGNFIQVSEVNSMLTLKWYLVPGYSYDCSDRYIIYIYIIGSVILDILYDGVIIWDHKPLLATACVQS